MSKFAAPPPKPAEIVREYGPFPDAEQVHGVTFDGERAWFATGTHLQAFDPGTGKAGPRLTAASDAGTAFDGRHFYQITGDVIQKLDAQSGELLGTIPAPGKGHDSGLAWAEGMLWVGQYGDRKIHAVDPRTGEVLRTIESDRFVTGVTWIDGELWHGTWENDESELRRIEPSTGEVRERLSMPQGTSVSGLESDGRDMFFCGGGKSGKVRAVRRSSKR
ncbi:MAG TPA: glutamine cyclotransferase [Polyangiaceae bacterium]|nr:glutamine cyclotransferase [Polyangiaceae bacterium]